MAETKIRQQHWNMIVKAIDRGLCVPFLGAGANFPDLPLGGAVARRLASEVLDVPLEGLDEALATVQGNLEQLEGLEVGSERPFGRYKDLLRLGVHDLARVALHVETNNGYPYLVDLLEEIIADEDCEPSPLLETLASLPLGLIVTTNYDRLMEKAYGKRPYEVVVQNMKGFSAEEQAYWRDRLTKTKRPIIYKLHGSFGVAEELTAADGGRPGKRVIVSEDDYIDFLTVAAIKDEGIPALISSKWANSVLLFLGYGLEDWDFRMIWKAVIEGLSTRDQRRSFAIQRHPSEGWEKFWDRKHVEIYDIDLTDFATELKERYASHLASQGR